VRFHAVELLGLPAPKILCRYKGCFPFKKTVEKIISKYQSVLPLIPISNFQAIVDGDSVKCS
jgi:hypothetical protein